MQIAVGVDRHRLFAAADQRNACVVNGGDQIATVLTDIKLCHPIIAIFKNSAYQNGLFAICSLRMLLVH